MVALECYQGWFRSSNFTWVGLLNLCAKIILKLYRNQLLKAPLTSNVGRRNSMPVYEKRKGRSLLLATTAPGTSRDAFYD